MEEKNEEAKPETEFNLVCMIEKSGNDASVKILSHAPIFHDEIREIVRGIEAALRLAAKHRGGPTPSIDINTSKLHALLDEEKRRHDILEESLADRGPEIPGISEEERVADLSERHGIEFATIKHLRERARNMLETTGATESEIATEGEGFGLPRTTALALVEDILESEE